MEPQRILRIGSGYRRCYPAYFDFNLALTVVAFRSRSPDRRVAAATSGVLEARGVATTAKVMVLVLTAGALFFAIYSSLSLVSLFLLGFAGIAQLLPGVVLGLYSRRVTTTGVFTGMATDISVATVLMVTGHDPFYGINAGFVALCFNFTVTVMTSLLMGLGASQSGDLSGQIKIGQVPRASESELPS